MQGVTRAACLGYLILLTALLLVADPWRFVGASGETPGLFDRLMPWAHLLGFGGLAVLAFAARWPIRPWQLVLLLVLYGGATEIAQSALPPRTAEWQDWFQDAAGVAIGASLCRGFAVAARRRKSRQGVLTQSSDGWEMAADAVPCRTATGRSRQDG